MIWGSGGSKSRLAKAAGAELAGQMYIVVARSTFPSQNVRVQNIPGPDHFWQLRCWKSARRVARSAFRSQNFKNTRGSDHFWRFRCRKSKRRCGAKHISKSKCTKHTMYGPFLEVQMSKKCTPLWREAHFEVKMYKTHHVRTIFGGSDVEKVHTVVARSTFRNQNVKNTRGSDHFWRFKCRFASLHYATLHYITLHYTLQHYNYNCTTTLHYTPLHLTTLHYTKLHYTTLHYTTLHSTTLHYSTLHYTPLHYKYNYNYTTTLHYTPLHSPTLHYTKLHYTKLHYTTLHYTTLHYITLHSSTTLHYTTLHSTTLQLQLHSTDR